MATTIVLLRGVNVGGHRIVKMEKLRVLLERGGFGNVRTYVQSGNALVESALSPAQVETKIARAIEKEFGFPVTVIARKPSELAKVIRENPFSGAERKHVYVSFLAGRPNAKRLSELPPGPDQCQLVGKHLYLHYAEGPGRTKLSGPLLERLLGVEGTSRNWNTINKLLEMAG